MDDDALVRSVFDYLHNLEDRVDAAREGRGAASDSDAKPVASRGNASSTSSSAASDAGSVHDNNIEPRVKFFNSRDYLDQKGQYVDVLSGTEKGKYMFNHGPKQLVRLLYTWKDDSARSQDGTGVDQESQDPDPKDIDIIALGVSSEYVVAFIAKDLRGEIHPFRYVLRFSRPFRSIVKRSERLREQLRKLESMYGYVLRI